MCGRSKVSRDKSCLYKKYTQLELISYHAYIGMENSAHATDSYFDAAEMDSDEKLLAAAESHDEEVRRAVRKECEDTGEWSQDLDNNVYVYIAAE